MLSILVLLASVPSMHCGWAPQPGRVPEPFYTIAVEFFDEAAARGKCWDNVPMLHVEFVDSFAPAHPSRAGTTWRNDIRISKHFWDQYDENQKRALLFHELAHWTGRNHVCEDTADSPCLPENTHELMYPWVLQSKDFGEHRKEIMDCLFSAVLCPGW